MKLQLMDTLDDWKEWTYSLALLSGAGGIISTAPDLLKFGAALGSGKLLKMKTLKEAYAPFILNDGQPEQSFDFTYCGLGWFIFKDTSNGKIIWGSGADPGAISFFAINLAKKQTLVILHNVKSNPFLDLNALDLLKGKLVIYRSSLAFTYAQDIYNKDKNYADAHLRELLPDTLHYSLELADVERATLEFRRAGLKKQALGTCEMGIHFFPAKADAFKNYAVTLAQYGQKEKAIEMYKKTLELNPRDTQSREDLQKLSD
jgi:tetratricopeptide (TPR) repeat protein